MCQVPDPKVKYQQLLFYAKKLKPLAAQLHTNENKVQGCVSQVRYSQRKVPDALADLRNTQAAWYTTTAGPCRFGCTLVLKMTKSIGRLTQTQPSPR